MGNNLEMIIFGVGTISIYAGGIAIAIRTARRKQQQGYEAHGCMRMPAVPIPESWLYGTEHTTVKINGRIGKGLMVDDYAAAVAYLDAHAQRIHLQEEPH